MLQAKFRTMVTGNEMATNQFKIPLHVIPAGKGGLRSCLFGYQLEYLPDFLADHTLLSERPQEKLDEVLERFVVFVAGLRKWRDTAFALRLRAQPDKGRIDLALLGRHSAPQQEIDARAAQIAADLGIHLTTFGFATRPLGIGGETQAELRDFLFPFDTPPAIVELRQGEGITPLHTINSDAYTVYPFWEPAATFAAPFESLLQQAYPVSISVYLEPTDLREDETTAFFEAAHLGQSAADQQVRTFSQQTAQRMRDPGAEMVGRLYDHFRRQLTEPFLLTVQIASPDPGTAATLSRLLGASIVQRKPPNQQMRGIGDFPPQYDLAVPRSEAEGAAALRTFTTLSFSPWGATRASAGKERFRYLAGPAGAAAAFRFPISVGSGVPGMEVRQRPPEFELGPRRPTAANEIHIGDLRRGGGVAVTLKGLTRHGLITGFTGSGKTNTMLYLLDQLWCKQRIPFLVIESAKKEYRSLLGQAGFDDLLIFTLGDETTSPFRLNPFELLDGVRLEAHLGRLQTCFDGALPQFGILPSIVAESLEQIYRDQGWQLRDRGGTQSHRFPTMRDMFRTALQVAETRGYAGETYHNIRAAVGGRIGSLLRGSKGRMFGAQASYPLNEWMNRPVILELNDLNAEDKSLTIMFLLMLLREYRELHPGDTLQHVTVVEEAHNVMGDVKSSGPSEISADTKGKAVEAFANLLTEVRSYGEGILIADQSPAKLLPDAIRNTNLQLAHQLRDATDREAIGRALLMDKTQLDYLGKLGVGEAAVFMTGMEKATFVQVPLYKDSAAFKNPPADSDVQWHMDKFVANHLQAHLPFDGCRFCGSPCEYVEFIEPQTRMPELNEAFVAALRGFEEEPEPEHWKKNWEQVASVCADAGRRAGKPGEVDAAYCYLAHEIDFSFTPHMRVQFEAAFQRLPGGDKHA